MASLLQSTGLNQQFADKTKLKYGQAQRCKTKTPTADLLQKSITKMNKCNANIQKCEVLTELASIMNQYNGTINQYISISYIKNLSNNFIHLINKHCLDEEFEYIYKCLGGYCDLKQCKIFDKHHNKRYQSKITIKNSITSVKSNNSNIDCDVAYQHIIDSIHCYYNHSYDIGHKLTIKEKQLIHNKFVSYDNYQKCESKHDELDQYLISKKVKTMNQLLSSKYNLSHRRRTQIKPSSPNANNDTLKKENMFSFGIKFNYNYNNDNNEDNEGTLVCPKYNSLKQELVSNNIQRINIHQFNAEYIKASIKFDSAFCRTVRDSENNNCNNLSMNHLLAIMIRCNYDILQYEFNKTYRPIHSNETNKDIALRHNGFYHLGKLLKEAVINFGRLFVDKFNINDRSRIFYHGISKQLSFTALNSGEKSACPCCYGTPINSPLSVSRCIEVAYQFATAKGIAIELKFGGHGRNEYFPVEWLSDYGNEKELLCCQSIQSMQFTDIIIPQSILQCNQFLRAFEMIDAIIRAGKLINDNYRRTCSFNCNYNMKLVKKVIEHQLSTKYNDYKSFQTKHDYIIKLINAFFENSVQNVNGIHQNMNLPDTLSWFLELVTDSNKCINFDIINILFPNINKKSNDHHLYEQLGSEMYYIQKIETEQREARRIAQITQQNKDEMNRIKRQFPQLVEATFKIFDQRTRGGGFHTVILLKENRNYNISANCNYSNCRNNRAISCDNCMQSFCLNHCKRLQMSDYEGKNAPLGLGICINCFANEIKKRGMYRALANDTLRFSFQYMKM